ncbi:MAG: addiction module protein [bacterium]
MEIEQIALELLGLPAKSRAVLAEKLISSLEDDEILQFESNWIEEAERRFRDIQNGSVTCKSAEEVVQKIHDRLR